MIDGRRVLGVGAGLCLAAGLLAVSERYRAAAPVARAGPLLSDCDGTIRELVIHYLPDAAPIVERAYRTFLPQVPEEVTVWVVCPDEAAFDHLRERVGPVRCALRPVAVGHAMTCWARDRWLALAPRVRGGPTTLLAPRGEAAAELWPQRAGDSRIADGLADALGDGVVSQRSPLYFDGGDFVADARTAFVAPAVLRRNLQRTVETEEELRSLLALQLQRRVVLLRNAPDHHVGMFLMAAGNGTVLVGDPSLAKPLLDEGAPPLCASAGGDDWSAATQARFDAVARQCAAAGYRVVRIPTVPGCDGRTYLTWLNVVLDARGGRGERGVRIVYLPMYAHARKLNQAAVAIWQGLGYQVRGVDCSGCYDHFGSLRCLVNVLRRGERGVR